MMSTTTSGNKPELDKMLLLPQKVAANSMTTNLLLLLLILPTGCLNSQDKLLEFIQRALNTLKASKVNSGQVERSR